MEIKLINGGLSVDDRGSVTFVNDFNFSDVKRFYIVENHRVGFIRAWHGHEKEGKYVFVVKGTALIGAVDMRSDSPKNTFYQIGVRKYYIYLLAVPTDLRRLRKTLG